MNIETRKSGPICILEMSGRVIHGDATQQLRDTVKELVGAGERRFVLDLSDVRAMDSVGIGEILACRNRVVSAEGQVRVVLGEKMHSVFLQLGLQKLVDVYRDIEHALDGLGE